jgi:glycosyltransferase involved in cell wall biosynthesis
MTICFFGNYIDDYPRVRVLREGFKQNSVEVLECHTRERGFKKYFKLYNQHKKIKGKYDIILVMMGGQTLVWFAKLLTKKKLIFDAFASLYITNVEDRKTCSAKSLKAKYYAWLDKISCKKANKVLLDTHAQIDYFVDKYKLDRNKFIRVFVSSDLSCQETSKIDNQFIVHWHGYIVPFYGLETVIKSAKILENHKDIKFQIVTRFNSKYEKIKKLVQKLNLDNIKFYPETDYHGIAKFINQADICLGVFGNNKKAQVVIPNKIYESIACAKPVITANHEVIKELFIDKENILLTKQEDPEDLAEKILQLKQEPNLLENIALAGHNIYLNKLQPKQIVKELIDKI